jgi:hypothetical protein
MVQMILLLHSKYFYEANATKAEKNGVKM